ncbi:1-phosphofructokinase [Methylobacterium indicum]|uniref:Phosphofructokinase n=1 Tax=Methylobacterium indicum TaxID=1775910 RepID=A0ABR5HIB5_9HYPH|nr:1-phosphofructokinase [Methylobacterium indicum]KMO23895.1 1-phosphofructokinase [Methylobacterium indicum]KMO26321.1 1-phosphofructokinase [Methylobacterium indicum]
MTRILTLTLNPAIDRTVTLDRLVPGAVHRARAMRDDAGGKGVNVASCLADWGVPITAAGVLGAGNAAVFEALFAAKGIADRCLRVAGETRTNLKLVDPAGTTDVNLPGLALDPASLDAVRAVLRAEAGPDTLAVLAGSLPAGAGTDLYAVLTAELKAGGTRVLLDASGAALAAALAAETLPDIVKPNRHELEEWAGRPLPTLADVVDAAADLVRRGIPLVVVSLGEDGAVFVRGQGAAVKALHALAPVVEVASTVGAGDALVAGLVAGLSADLALADTARLALAFAAGKLTRAGANLPDRAEIKGIARAIEVRVLPAAKI